MTAAVSAPARPCPVAPGDLCDFRDLGGFPDLSGKVGPVSVVQCRRCGHGVSLPPLADVAFLYAGRATQDFRQDGSRLGHAIKNVAFRRQARALLAQLPARPARVLDFGCGSGQFTRCLDDELGPGMVTGSDFETSPPADLTGRSYVPAGALAPLAGSFDCVLAMHVLEHDDDAAGLLGRIAAMARPGGILVIEVPNSECAWLKVFGKAWDAWYLPYHRSHFSRRSLRALVEQGGHTVLALHPATVPTMGRSLSNLVGGNKGLTWLLAGIGLHPLQVAGERLTGRPSALRIIARVGG
ncbi:class I SAM-dependent methyltransferase [Novosphingobium piscinae]|uniref:Class I SAM-dependent methyltransferase n=1 Tax=Novosphingobium piscinae TaxID=1507448 RepID=A0A7X1KRM3_9SPHN|nr:class I SAM-dependent methyltransferase [Novosphingobium piscinae]MBC2670902.1 class I SAM-dependent methyltransferase [Novosphingobium piscinae]